MKAAPNPASFSFASDVNSVLADWLTWLRHEKHFSSHTLSAYRRDLTAFLNYLSIQLDQPLSLIDLAALQRDDFNSYCTHLCAQGRASSSMARSLSTLRSFFRFLDSSGLVRNPVINALATPKAAKSTANLLSDEQALRILEVVTDLSDAPWIAKRDQALFALLYGSGLRLAEVLTLKRGQVPQSEPTVILGKENKQRVVAVLPSVPALLADYMHACPYPLDDDQALFVGARGRALNPGVVQRQLRRLRRFLGLSAKVTPQAFRKCFALRLRAEGGDLQAIQALLGHAHRATTQRYFSPKS